MHCVRIAVRFVGINVDQVPKNNRIICEQWIEIDRRTEKNQTITIRNSRDFQYTTPSRRKTMKRSVCWALPLYRMLADQVRRRTTTQIVRPIQMKWPHWPLVIQGLYKPTASICNWFYCGSSPIQFLEWINLVAVVMTQHLETATH